MIEQKAIVVNPPVQQSDRPARTLADLDRVVLADVRKEWVDFQSSRNRSAIYAYLHQVYMQVDWWSKNPKEKEAVLKAFRDANPNLNLPTDEYAAVIMCTADPKKIDGKMRSKLSRVLRYAEEYKPPNELLRDFNARAGSINVLPDTPDAWGEIARRKSSREKRGAVRWRVHVFTIYNVVIRIDQVVGDKSFRIVEQTNAEVDVHTSGTCRADHRLPIMIVDCMKSDMNIDGWYGPIRPYDQ